MDSELLKTVMQGASLHVPQPPFPDAVSLDLVAEGGGNVLFAQSGWWRKEWGIQDGILVFSGSVVPKADGVWMIDGNPDVTITNADTDADAERVAIQRRLQDSEKPRYISELRKLQAITLADIAPWITAVQARLPWSIDQENFDRALRIREIARIFLHGTDNKVLDVLVLDEDGDATTVHDNEWLTTFAERWVELEDVELRDYVEWIARQQPYGGLIISTPVITREPGSLGSIANRLMASS